MSREGAPSKKPKPVPAAGTPIWVWVIYAFGILAGGIVAFSVLFTLGALLLSGDPVSLHVSTPAIVLWGGVLAAAIVTFIVRRRQR